MVLLIISLVIRIFFLPLLFTLPLPMINLANETQIDKGIGSTHFLPHLPLTSILYSLDSPFSLISISKLIRDLNCSITFSNISITLQDWSTRRTIG